MKRLRHLTTAMACTLMAVLITSTAGLADVAVACVCPDGQVEVEAATVCSCCNPVSSDDRRVETRFASESPSCSDCVDVLLRVFPVKNDPLQLHTVTVSARCHATPTARVTGFGWDRPGPPDQGHRLTLALLSSVVLLT